MSLQIAMDAIRTRLTQVRDSSSSPSDLSPWLHSTLSLQSSSVSLHRSVSDDEEEEGGRVELKFVTSEAEEEGEVGPSSDVTALLLRYRHGYWRAGALLCVCGVVVFSIGTNTHT